LNRLKARKVFLVGTEAIVVPGRMRTLVQDVVKAHAGQLPARSICRPRAMEIGSVEKIRRAAPECVINALKESRGNAAFTRGATGGPHVPRVPVVSSNPEGLRNASIKDLVGHYSRLEIT